MVARFIEDQVATSGRTLRMPALTLARVVLAAADGLQLASVLDEDEDDLYAPFLEMANSMWEDTPPQV